MQVLAREQPANRASSRQPSEPQTSSYPNLSYKPPTPPRCLASKHQHQQAATEPRSNPIALAATSSQPPETMHSGRFLRSPLLQILLLLLFATATTLIPYTSASASPSPAALAFPSPLASPLAAPLPHPNPNPNPHPNPNSNPNPLPSPSPYPAPEPVPAPSPSLFKALMQLVRKRSPRGKYDEEGKDKKGKDFTQQVSDACTAGIEAAKQCEHKIDRKICCRWLRDAQRACLRLRDACHN